MLRLNDTFAVAYNHAQSFRISVGEGAATFNSATTFALNIDNLTDKEYYRSAALGTGAWGDPRSFKLTIITV